MHSCLEIQDLIITGLTSCGAMYFFTVSNYFFSDTVQFSHYNLQQHNTTHSIRHIHYFYANTHTKHSVASLN